MDEGTLDLALERAAKRPLDKFKHQGDIIKKFGEAGLNAYNALDGRVTCRQVMERFAIPEQKFSEIVDYMLQNSFAAVSSRAPEAPVPTIRPMSQMEERGEPTGAGEEAPLVIERRDAPEPKRNLSPLEKIIFDKYAEIGVQVYNLIDGEKTAEEILNETGISEVKLVEILEFMDKEGIIKLEKPESDAMAGGAEQPRDSTSPQFSPYIEENPERPEPINTDRKEEPEGAAGGGSDEPEEDIVPIDKPSFAKLNILQKTEMNASVQFKFGKDGMALLKLVDGENDFVDLAVKTRIALASLDEILGYLGKKGFVIFKPLSRQEIKKKYGDDGFSVYKKFGRDGILIYELIGKEGSLKDIISTSKIEPERAVDIFLFIHKVLGLDLPLDKDLIYKQLGLKRD
jgi:hypothetical protein